ncbi:MAG: rod shape-determining protein MreC [Candidatus Omnitrophica bacterium]|nr:rod shape-determining protein MreC [Candidatus Omnitrophota bacterium]
MKRSLVLVSVFIALFFLRGAIQYVFIAASGRFSSLPFLGFKNKGIEIQPGEISKIIQESEVKSHKIKDLENENRQLKDLLGLKKDFKNSVAARITGRLKEELAVNFMLDSGSKDGVKKDNAVMALSGLAGIIDYVGEDFSIMLPCFDHRFNISVRISSTREVALLSGRGKGRLFELLYLNSNTDAKPGDLVVTSGEGLLPKGLMVGTITELNMHSSQMYKTAYLEPFVDSSKIENVLILVK